MYFKNKLDWVFLYLKHSLPVSVEIMAKRNTPQRSMRHGTDIDDRWLSVDEIKFLNKTKRKL